MNTARVTKDVHVHKPKTRMIMTFTDKEGKKDSKLLNMGESAADRLILKTLRWASYNGIEVTFRPA